MGRVELFPFRFRDPVTGKWVRARYRAERHEIERRYGEFEIIGPPEIRDGDCEAPRFTPHCRRSLREPDSDHGATVSQLQPHLNRPPAIDGAEVGLLQLFLRRYVTYCARRRRYAAMNGAVRLFDELKRTAAADPRDWTNDVARRR